MHRLHRQAHFDQKRDQPGRQQQHRRDERHRHDHADVEMDDLRPEQQGDDQADRDRARDAQPDRGVDHRQSPVDQAQLPHMPLMLGTGRHRMQLLQLACAIDHARHPPDQHVQDAGDTRQQEHGRDRNLDRRGDGGDHGCLHEAQLMALIRYRQPIRNDFALEPAL